ncbi:MAG: hypothetical protein P8Z35_22315, partial [Ignavibacteriaceae bacterium]
MKKLSFVFLFLIAAFFLMNAIPLQAQEVVLSEQFDSGEGQWSSGWIDGANATASFSIDTNSV